ncbi:unnamed protein product [Durusdinium trenchii]|uniref:Pentatricopeptide repeat-containing protein, chloroplastic n=1 Tax=Durusdinium trenchii TaxID=1381693 RepID=A0ABP0L888_9DINO
MCEAASWGAAAHGHQRVPAQEPQESLKELTRYLCQFGKSRHWQEALALLWQAQDESLRLDLIAVNAAVNALSRSKAPGVLLQDPKSLWRQAFQLWNALVDRGLQGDLITSNTLANAGGVTWLASLRVLATWRRRALQVDSLGISATLGQAVDWRLGLALFTAATVDGTADLVLQNALCTLLERQDQWQRSLRFDTEQDMDLVAGACLLSACARGKLWAEALSTAQRLRSAGLEGNAMLGTSALTALEDHWRRASRLLDFLQLGQPNMVHIATLLMGDASRSAWNMALARFPRHEEMVTKRMSGPVARNCALVAMKKAWSWSLQLLEAVTPDVVSFNSAMESCGPLGGQWDFALLLLEAMQHRRSSPTLVSLSTYFNIQLSGCTPWRRLSESRIHSGLPGSLTVAGACQRCGQWRQALLALHQADADVTTFHARMTAALHSTKERVGEDSDGVLKEAWRSSLGHLLLLQAATLRKDLVTLNLGLAALGAGQRWGQALCWLLESCSRVLHSADAVDQVTYGALLGARFPSALALKLLERMKQQDLEPNAVIHSAVLGACERDGNLAAVPGSVGALAQAGTALNS